MIRVSNPSVFLPRGKNIISKFALFHWVPLRKSRESCEPLSHPQNSSNFLALFGFTDHWNLNFTKSNHSHQLHLSGWTLLSFFNMRLLVCASVGLKIYALWSMDQNWQVDFIIVRYNAYIKDTLCWSQRGPWPQIYANKGIMEIYKWKTEIRPLSKMGLAPPCWIDTSYSYEKRLLN